MTTHKHERTRLDELIENPDLIQKVVVIFNYGRSGSYLLSSLFDNHTETLSLTPAGLQIFPVLHGYRGKSDSLEELVSYVLETLRNIFTESQDPAFTECRDPQTQFAEIVRLVFSRFLANGHHLNEANVFKGIHLAYARMCKRELSTLNPLVVWQLHGPKPTVRSVGTLLYKDIRFLTAVRLPEKTYNSHLDYLLKRRHVFPSHMNVPAENSLPVYLLSELLTVMRCKGEDDDSRSLAVRFEDMHTQVEEVMRALATWLSIGWEPILLESTFDGKPYIFPKGGGGASQG